MWEAMPLFRGRFVSKVLVMGQHHELYCECHTILTTREPFSSGGFATTRKPCLYGSLSHNKRAFVYRRLSHNARAFMSAVALART